MSFVRIIGKGRIRAQVFGAKIAVRRAVMKTMFEHGLFVMARTLPITPFDTGMLRASWFVKKKNSETGPVVRIGFAAAYAKEVHDNLADKIFQEPGTRDHFLEEMIEKHKNRLSKNLRSALSQAVKKAVRKLK